MGYANINFSALVDLLIEKHELLPRISKIKISLIEKLKNSTALVPGCRKTNSDI